MIIDDFGLQTLDVHNRLMLLEIIEDRHGKKSTIISSQLPADKWYDVIGDGSIADAILDRLLNCSHKIELKGATNGPMDDLDSFTGFVQTDGYPGYTYLAEKKDLVHLSCWAHARRYQYLQIIKSLSIIIYLTI